MARRRYQRGSVFLRGKKRPVWVGRWREGERSVLRPDGTRKQVRIFRSKVIGYKHEIPTERLALRTLEREMARINNTAFRDGRVCGVKEFADEWFAVHASKRKPSTSRAVRGHIENHIKPNLGQLDLDKVGEREQQIFVNRLLDKVSRKTALNIIGTLSAMLNTAERWGYIAAKVKLQNLSLPARPGKPPRVFSPTEATAIMTATRGQDRAVYATAAMTGLRAGEIFGLQVQDVDFGAGLLNVRRTVWRGKVQTTKSLRSSAVLPLPSALQGELQPHVEGRGPEEFVFQNRAGRPFQTEKFVRSHLRPLLKKLSLPNGGMHAFRHLHTSLLLATGAPPTVAQAQLRHSDARITLGVYGHVIGDAHRTAVEKVAMSFAPTCARKD